MKRRKHQHPVKGTDNASQRNKPDGNALGYVGTKSLAQGVTLTNPWGTDDTGIHAWASGLPIDRLEAAELDYLHEHAGLFACREILHYFASNWDQARWTEQ